MSANTKIIVLKRKKLILYGIFAISFALLLMIIISSLNKGTSPQKTSSNESYNISTQAGSETASSGADISQDTLDVISDNALDVTDAQIDSTQEKLSPSSYIPGIYTTELVLGEKSVNVEVLIDNNGISSISLSNIDNDIKSLYPLLEPTLASLSQKVCEAQDVENITMDSQAKYTSMVLLEAIKGSLDRARKQ